MTILAIQKMGGFCPAGTLRELFLLLENSQPLEGEVMAGECNAAGLKQSPRMPSGPLLRRVPRLAKIALRAALDAVDWPSGLEALIISAFYGSVTSTFEFLDSILNDGADLASPTAFSHTVTNMTTAFVSQYLKITGPCLTLTQPLLTPSLEAAWALLSGGQVTNVLWGAVSERSSDMAAIEKLSARQPVTLTDGAVFFELCLPNPHHQEILVEFGSQESSGFEPSPYGDLVFGSGSLALAFRLALTSLLAEKSSDRSLSQVVSDGRERLVISLSRSGL
ncbi:MAG: beta-ketoacyl synthase chain length factor [Deltaproteobacteria bacterium]|jgi:3-oxoacyl-[acyl-carrier-protein] synthase II|nr:beta-ketoacyl synthase chain length factor [Deltaproteobacteria bacterium]